MLPDQFAMNWTELLPNGCYFGISAIYSDKLNCLVQWKLQYQFYCLAALSTCEYYKTDETIFQKCKPLQNVIALIHIAITFCNGLHFWNMVFIIF
jgi:hypothetical protein